MEDELLMAIPPKFLPKIIEGLGHLSANGLRYPIPPYGIQQDVRAGMGASFSLLLMTWSAPRARAKRSSSRSATTSRAGA